MKFGKSISSQQDANAELHYVDYKLLKDAIKNVIGPLQDGQLAEALTANTAFEGSLGAEIAQVNVCFGRVKLELTARTASLSEDLSESTPSSACSAFPRTEVFRRLVSVLVAVDQLRMYAVWNAVAIVKILKKRRKQTSFGLEDTAAERSGWLLRQSFFSGSDFAELHATVDSLGHMLMKSELVPHGAAKVVQEPPPQCPICLDPISDMVELSCDHRFCWKCFVLGPIAHQPGEYRISQCPVCRREATQVSPQAVRDGIEEGEASASDVSVRSAGMLSRFLHTYFPQGEMRNRLHEEMQGEQEMRDVVGELLAALRTDPTGQEFVDAQEGHASGSGGRAHCSSDFFKTLPVKDPANESELASAQKMQWLQVAAMGDPLFLDGATYCSLCAEPLYTEAVVTTPCKHHFHRVCINRIDLPQCPLCTSQLPFNWFVPNDHPCAERGFRVISPSAYRPHFAGGPSRGSGGWPLHKPPPVSLHGPGRLTMKSYLHHIVPMGDEGNDGPVGARAQGISEDACEESSSGSSSDSQDSDDASPKRHTSKDSNGKPARRFLYSAIGRMRLCEPPGGMPPQARPGMSFKKPAPGGYSAGKAPAAQRSSPVIRIGDHL